jgi:hypothetical protein
MTDTAPTPTPLSPEQIATTDALIMAAATAEWCKVAVLISRTVDLAKAQNLDVPSSAIVTRIYALAESKALATQGNVRRWRAGEVRKG